MNVQSTFTLKITIFIKGYCTRFCLLYIYNTDKFSIDTKVLKLIFVHEIAPNVSCCNNVIKKNLMNILKYKMENSTIYNINRVCGKELS